jgi:hypothetical protein
MDFCIPLPEAINPNHDECGIDYRIGSFFMNRSEFNLENR